MTIIESGSIPWPPPARAQGDGCTVVADRDGVVAVIKDLTAPSLLTRADGTTDTLDDPTPERVGQWLAANPGGNALYDRVLPDDDRKRVTSEAMHLLGIAPSP